MNKKTSSVFALFLILLICLTACGKKYGTIVVDEKGMEHIIMTDANGVTVCDNKGNLVEIVTDNNKKPIPVPTENGTRGEHVDYDYQTNVVTFPGVVKDGNVLEEALYKVTVPDGWEDVGSGRVILEHKETEAVVSIYTNMGDSLEQKLEQLDNDRAVLDADFEYNESESSIDGYDAVKEEYEIGEIYRCVYVLQTERAGVVEISCTVKLTQKDAVDFNAVLSGIHFK